MARIELRDVGHSYLTPADDWALEPMTMTWADGGAYALLGPSGCGKTTLLNIISGLVAPTRGRVQFDDRDVTQLAPQERNIAQVFQFPVVYDTMTVFDNLAFPLRNRRWPKAKIRVRVHEIAEILELLPDLQRRAHGLSADVRQKISLGRGLVRPFVELVDRAGTNCVPAQVRAIRDQGAHTMVQLEVGSALQLWAKLRHARSLPGEGQTFVHLPASRCALYADDRRVA